MAQVIAIFRISINMTPLDGVCVCVCGCLIIIRKACPWVTVGYLFGKCHAHWTLKNAFVDFETEEVHCGCYTRFNLSSLLV